MTEYGEWAHNTKSTKELKQAAKELYLGQVAEGVRTTEPNQCFNLLDISPIVTDGMRTMVDDEFNRCFTSSRYEPWNWTWYLFPMWVLGIILRHCILFPIRLIIFIGGTLYTAIAFIIVSNLVKNKSTKIRLQRAIIRQYASVWVASWNGVIKYHGIKPSRHPNQIVVANHTTVLDICVLLQDSDYAIIGQKQPGIIGFAEEYLLSAMGCIWFERNDANDRSYVAKRIREHIREVNNSPLLMFPEGTCVNNEYCVMFKKGAFEIDDAIIYPVAIKYKYNQTNNKKKNRIELECFVVFFFFVCVCVCVCFML